MAKLGISALSVLLLAALQVGCVATPERAEVHSSFEIPRPTCDTSVGYIHLVARIRNDYGEDVEFNLDGDAGPPYDPWYMGYRVHAGGPGQPFGLVHNSGHDSVWTGTVAVAEGASVDFNVPIFGLRPADYRRLFRIEVRDSKGRSYWTQPFELCAVSRAPCGCPGPGGGLVLSPQPPRQVCRAAPVRERCE